MSTENQVSTITQEEAERQNLPVVTRLLRKRVHDLILTQGDNLSDMGYLFLRSRDGKTLFSLHTSDCSIDTGELTGRRFRKYDGTFYSEASNMRFDIAQFDIGSGLKPARRYSPLTVPVDRYVTILGTSNGAYLSPYQYPDMTSAELMGVYDAVSSATKLNPDQFLKAATGSAKQR